MTASLAASLRLPPGWKLVRNKYVFREINDPSTDGTEEMLTVSHLTGVTRRSEKDVYMFQAETNEGQKRCQAGDLVINTMWAWMGAAGVARESGIVSPAYAVYRPIEPCNPWYYDLLIRTPFYVGEMASRSTGVWRSRLRLYPESFLSMPTIVPPKSKQTEIVTRVNSEVARIDSLLSGKQRLLLLLHEKRAEVINRIVTTGLDRSTTRKDSGTGWLGSIPEHWDVRKVKHLCSSITSGPRGWAEYYSNDGSLFLRIGNLDRASINLDLSDTQYVRPPDSEEARRARAQSGDLLVSITAHIGTVAAVPPTISSAFVSQHLACARPRQSQTSGEWLARFLSGHAAQRQFAEFIRGGTKDGIGLDDVGSLVVALPPPEEQKSILAWLAKFDSSVRTLGDKLLASMALLRERRQAMIADAVTGGLESTKRSPREVMAA